MWLLIHAEISQSMLVKGATGVWNALAWLEEDNIHARSTSELTRLRIIMNAE